MIAARLVTMGVGNPTGSNQYEKKRNDLSLGDSTPPPVSITDAARMTAVSRASVDNARTVRAHGTRGLAAAVEAGKGR
jgi:hypothetical protein